MSGPLRLGSLCTGAAMLDMAVAQVLDVETAWHAENDPHASRVLAHRFPNVPNLGDLTAVDWAAVDPVDVMCFGFPCQDISYAGRGAGITEGTRSGLWYACWDAVRVLRPRYVFVENVSALLVRRPGFDVVISDMAADGYDARWTCLRASDIGAPHARNRLWIVAADTVLAGAGRDGRAVPRPSTRPRRAGIDVHAAVDGRPAPPHPDSPGLQRPGSAQAAGDAEPSRRRRPAAHTDREAGRSGAWHPEPGDGAATHGGRGPAESRGRRGPAADPDGERLTLWPELDGDTLTREADDPSRHDVHGLGDASWGVYGPAIRRWERVFGRTPPAPVDHERRLSPPFVEWMMGLPAGWVTDVPGIPRTGQLALLGNGVVPAQGAAAYRSLLEAEARESAA